MGSKNPLFGLVWVALLLFLAWPVAGFCAAVWLILQPFEPFLNFVKDINNFLEKIVTWPKTCGKAIYDCSSHFPAPY